MDVTAEWIRLMRLPEDRLRLDEAALTIALHGNPALDIAAQTERLDEMAARLDESNVDALCSLLFDRLKFRGDHATYGDPRNSYLDAVLDRRLGIPITLAVLMLEVGRRRGIILHGVAMPGHFLIRDPERPDTLLDPFSGGRRLTTERCAALLRARVGVNVPLTRAMLVNVGPRAILARMLANLTNTFVQSRDHESLVWATRLRVMIPGMRLSERVAAVGTLAEVGRHLQAAAILDQVTDAMMVDDVQGADQLRASAQALRAMLN